MREGLTSQESIRRFIMLLFSMIGFVLTGVAVIHFRTNIPFVYFTGDPAATFGYNPLFEFVSNTGILLWCACASVCFLSASILKTKKGEGEISRFLFCFGVLTTVLMLDDFFMFHEYWARKYLCMSEKVLLVCYGAYFLGCMYYFRRIILMHNLTYLILAVMFFGLSVVIDQISEIFYMPGKCLLEDGLKLIAIGNWLIYFSDLSFREMILTMAKG